MNNTQYIAALKRELTGIGHQARKDIVQEIQSHIKELGNTDSLLERFGSPEYLAKQYLEEYPPRLSLSNRLMRIGKGYFIAMGIGLTAIIAIILVSAMVLFGDKFDYVNESAPELDPSSGKWMLAQWNQPIRIEVLQGEMVIYWHDDNRVKWRCEGKDLQLSPELSLEQIFQVQHGFCIVFLPPSASTIKVIQGSVVLVRPQASTKVEITQGKLRIAENGASYRYNMDADDSTTIEEFASLDTSNIDINIVAKQAVVEAYVYDSGLLDWK